MPLHMCLSGMHMPVNLIKYRISVSIRCYMRDVYIWITVSVDHIAVLAKDRPLSIVPIIVDYFTVYVNRPVKK